MKLNEMIRMKGLMEAQSKCSFSYNEGHGMSLFPECFIIPHLCWGPSCGLFWSHAKNVQGFQSLCVVGKTAVYLLFPLPASLGQLSFLTLSFQRSGGS